MKRNLAGMFMDRLQRQRRLVLMLFFLEEMVPEEIHLVLLSEYKDDSYTVKEITDIIVEVEMLCQTCKVEKYCKR